MPYTSRYAIQVEILKHVSAPRWAGGVHRDHLAHLLIRKPWDQTLKIALLALYRERKIDFIQNYVVMPGGRH